jgi:5-methylcytosine-specific restriction endonuclease McrA
MNTDELSHTGRNAESVIPDEVEDGSPLEIAPDRRRVKTDKQDLPVETLTGRVSRAAFVAKRSDADIDHIKHYWRGGKTIPENARLTHRYCNRKRGGRDV